MSEQSATAFKAAVWDAVDYKPSELSAAIDEAANYLRAQHREVCIGCDRCTRIAMLDIASCAFEMLADPNDV